MVDLISFKNSIKTFTYYLKWHSLIIKGNTHEV